MLVQCVFLSFSVERLLTVYEVYEAFVIVGATITYLGCTTKLLCIKTLNGMLHIQPRIERMASSRENQKQY